MPKQRSTSIIRELIHSFISTENVVIAEKKNPGKVTGQIIKLGETMREITEITLLDMHFYIARAVQMFVTRIKESRVYARYKPHFNQVDIATLIVQQIGNKTFYRSKEIVWQPLSKFCTKFIKSINFDLTDVNERCAGGKCTQKHVYTELPEEKGEVTVKNCRHDYITQVYTWSLMASYLLNVVLKRDFVELYKRYNRHEFRRREFATLIEKIHTECATYITEAIVLVVQSFISAKDIQKMLKRNRDKCEFCGICNCHGINPKCADFVKK